MKIEVRRILVTLVVLVVMSPTMAIAAAWYRCTMDGEVRSACCCPEDKSEEATDIPSDAPPVLRATCCEVETLSAAASQPRLKADLTLAALGLLGVAVLAVRLLPLAEVYAQYPRHVSAAEDQLLVSLLPDLWLSQELPDLTTPKGPMIVTAEGALLGVPAELRSIAFVALGLAQDPPHWSENMRNPVKRRLDRFGKTPDRFNLIHGDMRLANLLMDNGTIKVIDFDDCGFSWFLYDCATTVSFFEDSPDVPALIEAWVRGYRRVGTLSAEEVAEIDTFVMLRRLLLVAWIGSHSETELAQSMGVAYTKSTLPLCERYLSRFG